MYKKMLTLAGIIWMFSAIWHAIAFVEPNWLVQARAPLVVIESAKNGTWLAPIASVGLAILMFICGAYSFSAAQIIRPLPFYKFTYFFIAIICITRNVLVVPILIRHLDRVQAFDVLAVLIWAFVGICFLIAAMKTFDFGKCRNSQS